MFCFQTSPEALKQAKRIQEAREARRRANNYRDIAVAPTGYAEMDSVERENELNSR
jgi:hypothetical protein